MSIIGKRKSISVQVFMGIVFMFLFVIIIFAVMIDRSYAEMLEEMEINYHLEVTNTTKEQFNVLNDMIGESSYAVRSNIYVEKALKMKDNQNITSKLSEQIYTYIDAVVDMNYSINNVYILGSNGYYCSTNPQFREKEVYSYYKQYLDYYKEHDERTEIWTEFHTTEEDDYLSSTSYVRPVFNSETKEIYGIVVLDISYESLHKIFTTSSIQLEDRAIIVNTDGNILFQYPIQSDYKEVIQKYPEVLNGNVQLEGELYKNDVIIVSERLAMADWNIVRFVQKDVATEMLRRVLRITQWVLAITAIIALIYTGWLTRLIVFPIKELMRLCEKVGAGDFSAQIHVDREDEIGKLGHTLNSMIFQINKSFEREREEQKRKSEMEFQILQAQINPHFLYNTLDSIRWLAVMQGVDNIGEMSLALIHLLKYNLGKVEGDTTLKDEIESVRNYIVIQKYRYSDGFEFTTWVEKEAEKCKVLRFILQPLVENSIIHGFREESSEYRIHIAAVISEGKLHIKVIDNGAGMDRESMKQLNTGEKEVTRFSKIGVENIRERIKLHFGEGAQLIFDSEPNIATIAEVIIPAIYSEE